MGGQRFTYMWGNGKSLSKIDRILVCQQFFNNWPGAILTALPRDGRSDHSPLLIKAIGLDFGPPPFKFYNSWCEWPGFDDFGG